MASPLCIPIWHAFRHQLAHIGLYLPALSHVLQVYFGNCEPDMVHHFAFVKGQQNYVRTSATGGHKDPAVPSLFRQVLHSATDPVCGLQVPSAHCMYLCCPDCATAVINRR